MHLKSFISNLLGDGVPFDFLASDTALFSILLLSFNYISFRCASVCGLYSVHFLFVQAYALQPPQAFEFILWHTVYIRGMQKLKLPCEINILVTLRVMAH